MMLTVFGGVGGWRLGGWRLGGWGLGVGGGGGGGGFVHETFYTNQSKANITRFTTVVTFHCQNKFNKEATELKIMHRIDRGSFLTRLFSLRIKELRNKVYTVNFSSIN